MGKKVLYVAPELPSLSATFVYNEILKLQELGGVIASATVHEPVAHASSEIEKSIGSVFNIYQQTWPDRLKALLCILIKHPLLFSHALIWLVKDIVSLGFWNRLAAGQVFRFISASVLARHAMAIKAEHIHTHFAHVPTDITMYAAKMANIPFSFTSHANDIFERGWLLAQKVDRCKFTVTISHFNKHFLSGIKHLNTNKVQVIHCGVDSQSFPMALRNPQPLFTFGFLARLVEKKGAEVLIRAAFRLTKLNLAFKVVIVGDGPLFNDLLELVQTLKLEDNVVMCGSMPNSHVPEWFKTIDAFVLPAVVDRNGDMDGIPVSLMEAMCSGVPVISSDISGVKELVIADKTGLLVKSNCQLSLMKAMLRLFYMGHEKRTSLINTAKSHIHQSFDQTINAKALAHLIIAD